MKLLLKDAGKFISYMWVNHRDSMILITLIIAMFIGVYRITSNERKVAKQNRYDNIELRVVSINSDCSLTNDKFHKPQLCNTVLFETISEPHLYCEINTCNKTPGIHIDTEWLYNHQKGDIVHFDYLCKDRFFEIKKR